MKKKLLAALLATAMTVTMFAGCGTPGRKCYPNHHPKFEIEESALADGVLLHLAAVVSAMHREKEK